MKQATTRRALAAPQNGPLRQRLKEGGIILFSSISIYFLIALLSYNQADTGWSHSSVNTEIQNITGAMGAWFSDFFYSLFGFLAYLFPLTLALSGYYLYRDHEPHESTASLLWTIRSFGLIFTLLGGCGLTALHFEQSTTTLPMNSGGLLGSFVKSAIVPYSSLVGSSLVLATLLLVGITLLTGFSWLELFRKLAHQMMGVLANMRRGMSPMLANTLTRAKQIPIPALPQLFSRTNESDQNLPTQSEIVDFGKIVQEEDKQENEEGEGSFAKLFRKKENSSPVKMKKASSSVTEAMVPPVRDFLDGASLKPTQTRKVVARKPKETKAEPAKPFDGTLSLDLLDEAQAPQQKGYTSNQLHDLARLVETRLLEFGVDVKVVGVLPGPVITRFELDLAAGIKVNKITGLAKDLARSLSVVSVRVVEVIPGKSVVGLEIPNVHRELVRLKEILIDATYERAVSPLTMALGKDIAGRPVAVDLAKMPHLLVAGTTGSGKSVGLNAMLLSILYKATPENVRMILIDPKMLELAVYDNIPHLLTPVVTDMKDAANALRWCVAEMERRYQLMAALGVRNLMGYNQKVADGIANNNPIHDPLWNPQSPEPPECLEKLPYIVVVVDEFADMIMVVGKKVEELIARIAQKARAAGIHLILATQRPSVDVITGLIKANIPTRIAFQVSSRIDSRTILDQSGAEQLLGHGDMLYLPPGVGVPHRIHGAFVSDEEVHNVAQELRKLGSPDYIESITQSSAVSSNMSVDDEDYDELYDQAVAVVVESRKASISLVQRKLKIGYNRAARLIEKMESEGLVSAMQSNGTREVVAPPFIDE